MFTVDEPTAETIRRAGILASAIARPMKVSDQ